MCCYQYYPYQRRVARIPIIFRDFVYRLYRRAEPAAVIWLIYCQTMLADWIWDSYLRITYGFYPSRLVGQGHGAGQTKIANRSFLT